MDSLARLPGDILAYLSTPSYSYLALQLWKTGDKLLMAKLTSCMTHMTLKDVNGKRRFLPSCLLEFRSLRHLSLSTKLNQAILENPTRWASFFKELPETLETLEIVGKDAGSALLNYAPDSDPSDHALVFTQYQRGRSPLIGLGSMFPRLTTLRVNVPYGSNSMDTSTFPGLPSTLTTLDIQTQLGIAREGLETGVGGLPRSLLHLKGSIELLGTNGLTNWPPNLQHIEWSLKSSIQVTSTEWLPRSLLTMTNMTFVTWSLDMARNLPPLLQELSLTPSEAHLVLGQSWVAELPRSITILHLQSSLRSLGDFPFPLADLPPLLTKLSSTTLFKGWDDIKRQLVDAEAMGLKYLWPSNLEHLDLRKVVINSEDLKLLPKGLLSLKTMTSCAEEGENRVYLLSIDKLFPKLLSVGITCYSSMSVSIALPAGLTSAKLVQQTNTNMGLDFPVSSTWNPMDGPRLLISGSTSLLTRLSVSDWLCDNMGLLPCGLTSLDIARLNGLTTSELVKQGNLLATLPSGLRRLSVWANGFEASNEVIKISNWSSSLRPIQTLDIQSICLPSSFVRFLPPTVTIARLKLENLEPEDALFLPPSLTNLTLGPHVRLEDDATRPFLPNHTRKRAAFWLRDEFGLYHV